MGENEKIKEIINWLEYIKEQINTLEQNIMKKENEEDIKYLFDELTKITGVQFDGVIYVDNDTVKYIAKEDKSNGNNVLLVKKNEGHSVKGHRVEIGSAGHFVYINYDKIYDIPDYILEILKRLPDNEMTAVKYVDPNISKIYLLLKQGYYLGFYSS